MFKVNDRVKVIDKSSKLYGRIGTIIHLNFLGKDGYHVVIVDDSVVLHKSQLEHVRAL